MSEWCDEGSFHWFRLADLNGMAITAAQVVRCAVPSTTPSALRWGGEAVRSPPDQGIVLASRPGLGLIPKEEGRNEHEQDRKEYEEGQLRGCQRVDAVPCDIGEGKGRKGEQASRRSRVYRAARLCGYVDGLADEEGRRRGDRRCGFVFGDKLCAYVDPLTPAYTTVDRETNGEAEGCRRCANFASNKVRRANAGHSRRKGRRRERKKGDWEEGGCRRGDRDGCACGGRGGEGGSRSAKGTRIALVTNSPTAPLTGTIEEHTVTQWNITCTNHTLWSCPEACSRHAILSCGGWDGDGFVG